MNAITNIIRDICELHYDAGGFDEEDMAAVSITDLRRILERHLAAPAVANAATGELPPLPATSWTGDNTFDFGGNMFKWTDHNMHYYGQACHALGRGAAVREYIANGTFKHDAIAATAPNTAVMPAIQAIASIGEALGTDENEGGPEPILEAIAAMKKRETSVSNMMRAWKIGEMSSDDVCMSLFGLFSSAPAISDSADPYAKLVEALNTIAAQSSNIPGSTARADCMASIARAALAAHAGQGAKA